MLGNRLARENLAGQLVGAEVGDAELAPAQLLAQRVLLADLMAGWVLEDGELGPGWVGGPVVVQGEGVLLVALPGLGVGGGVVFRRWSRATVAHD